MIMEETKSLDYVNKETKKPSLNRALRRKFASLGWYDAIKEAFVPVDTSKMSQKELNEYLNAVNMIKY
jgi:hypothetical protein